MTEAYRVAIAQVEAVAGSVTRSLDRAVKACETASREGARLVVFGETWLPGYPVWLDVCSGAALWNHAPVKRVFAALRANSIEWDGDEVRRLRQAAGDLKMAIVMGASERAGGTLYNSLFSFSSEGELANHHRKLMPTYTERMVWGHGDGAGLKTFAEGAQKIGGLVCWEHWMPAARMAMHESGETIHVAVWPTVHEMHQIASRQYAFEGRCYVLAAGLLMRGSDLPAELAGSMEMVPEWVCCGGSAVIGPDGMYVVEPVFEREAMLYADLEMSRIDEELMTLDVTGHYARKDVFSFAVNRDRG